MTSKGGGDRSVVVRNLLKEKIQETLLDSVCSLEMSDYCHFTLNNMDKTRIVILGKTGVGKSSVVNTILGEEVFQVSFNGNSETRECQSVTRRVDERDVTLIDTPGLFDTDRSEEELKADIVSCITECAPGPHAFIIVFKVEPFTQQEQEVINKINKYFSKEAFKYATLLFTQGDQLDEGQTIEEYFHKNKLVSDLMKKCGGRCHVIDNKYWKNEQLDENRSNQFQVKKLLETIHHMMKANKGSCFTNEMLRYVEKLIQEQVEKIRKSPGNMKKGEIRKKAKRRVYAMLLIKCTGVTAGALLASLFGVVMLVGVEAALIAAGSVVAVAAGSVMAVGAVGGLIKRRCDVTSIFKDQEKSAEVTSESKPLIPTSDS